MMDVQYYSVKAKTRNGMSVHIRAIQSDDKQLLSNGFHRLSARSVYLRFFSSKRELSEKELKYLTEIDYKSHVALVATVPDRKSERIIGVGRYVEVKQKDTSDRVAEVAITVDDAHQNLGIGRILFDHLVRVASEMGIDQFVADILPGNRHLLAIIARTGFVFENSQNSDVEHIVYSLPK